MFKVTKFTIDGKTEHISFTDMNTFIISLFDKNNFNKNEHWAPAVAHLPDMKYTLFYHDWGKDGIDPLGRKIPKNKNFKLWSGTVMIAGHHVTLESVEDEIEAAMAGKYEGVDEVKMIRSNNTIQYKGCTNDKLCNDLIEAFWWCLSMMNSQATQDYYNIQNVERKPCMYFIKK